MTAALVGPTLAAVLMLGGWVLAQTRDSHGLPIRVRVSVGETLASIGMLVGVLTLPFDLPPSSYAAGVVLVLAWGLLLIRGAGRLAIGWTSGAEILTSAVGIGWTRPRRALWSLLSLIGGLALTIGLAGLGEPMAGVLGAAVILAPARWHLPAGYARETARTRVESAMAGVVSGGFEWGRDEANLRGAPVTLRFDAEQNPLRVTAPLPPGWKSASEETLSTEVNARLREGSAARIGDNQSVQQTQQQRTDTVYAGTFRLRGIYTGKLRGSLALTSRFPV